MNKTKETNYNTNKKKPWATTRCQLFNWLYNHAQFKQTPSSC